MSESNSVLIRYVPEVTFNTTPVDDAGWKTLPHNSESISARPVTTESTRIRTDRMVQDQVKVNEENGGSVDFDLSYSDFEDMIEAAMCTTWAVNTATLGTEDKSFTIEKEYSDLSTVKYLAISGCRVNTLDLRFRFGEIVTGAVSFMGCTGSESETSAVGVGSTAAISSDEIMAANVDMDSVTYDGTSIATSGIVVEEITLSINNNLRPNYSLLSTGPLDQKKGTARVQGRMVAYCSADAWELYQDMLNNTGVSLAWTITDGAGKGYTFTLPSIKVSGDAPASGGQDQDVMIEADFVAIESLPSITRIP